MPIEGKQFQVNLWLDNKKSLQSCFPWGSHTQSDDKQLKKALSEGLHDTSVHMKEKKIHFWKLSNSNRLDLCDTL